MTARRRPGRAARRLSRERTRGARRTRRGSASRGASVPSKSSATRIRSGARRRAFSSPVRLLSAIGGPRLSQFRFCYDERVGGDAGREDYLERLIEGLELAIPENREKLQYYKPDELQHVYTVKFLAKM